MGIPRSLKKGGLVKKVRRKLPAALSTRQKEKHVKSKIRKLTSALRNASVKKLKRKESRVKSKLSRKMRAPKKPKKVVVKKGPSNKAKEKLKKKLKNRYKRRANQVAKSEQRKMQQLKGKIGKASKDAASRQQHSVH